MAPKSTALSKTTAFLSTAASVAASAVLLRTVVNEVLPTEAQEYFYSAVHKLFGDLSSDFTVVIEEFEGFATNEIYEAVRTYLGGRTSPTTRRVRASKQADEKNVVVTIETGEEVDDVFQGVQFRWRLVCQQGARNQQSTRHSDDVVNTRSFELSFHRKHKDKAMGSYLPHVMSTSEKIKAGDKALKLHMLSYDAWNSVSLDHPATFDTLAMEPDLKQMVMEDLRKFVESKDYYRRVGKAWKRGYLLYGPPGTGKSSLVAAMANFLRFDIYDLELTEVSSNTSLRTLMVGTASRSILVVEDIDCTIDVCNRNREAGGEAADQSQDREEKVTLSGLLNFIDGLWSSCGEQRIIVFTTNHKERLDPALLRPGRMDMHIHMGYCSPAGFRTLASNYHGVDEHPLFGEIESLIREVEVTPAEVAGELMKSGDAETALQGLLRFLRQKKTTTTTTRGNGEVDGEEKGAGLTTQMGTDGDPDKTEREALADDAERNT